MQKLLDLGPWAGIDNVHRAHVGVFQLPGELEKRRPALVSALDVDFNDDGWPQARQPVESEAVLTSGLGAWRVGGRTFYQDGSTLYERSTGVGADAPRLEGLAGRVMMTEFWDRIYVTDGVSAWVLTAEGIAVWGLPVPDVGLAPASGSLAPGIYLVQLAFVDAEGNEGGTSDVASATLSSATGIEISMRGASPDVVAVNVYVSQQDQPHTSYIRTVPLAGMPCVVQTHVTAADPPKTLQMTGPIAGAEGLFSFRAFLLMWRDNVVFRSEGAEPHLFHGENIMQFSADVRACEGVAGGMWIGTADGLWWVVGDNPNTWVPTRKTTDAVVRGSMLLEGEKLPATQTADRVALFVTTQGLVAGRADGSVVHLTHDTYKFDAATRVSFVYSERDELRQLLINLVDDNGSF